MRVRRVRISRSRTKAPKIKISTPNLNRAKRQTLSAKPKKVK